MKTVIFFLTFWKKIHFEIFWKFWILLKFLKFWIFFEFYFILEFWNFLKFLKFFEIFEILENFEMGGDIWMRIYFRKHEVYNFIVACYTCLYILSRVTNSSNQWNLITMKNNNLDGS
jgi:hypothetical protein